MGSRRQPVWRLLGALLALVACAPASTRPSPPTSPAREQVARDERVVLEAPEPEALIESPLECRGRARGSWFFEATFPVSLLDGRGAVVARHYAQASGEWMTESFVPFEARLVFDRPATDTGVLVLHRANASGLPEHDAEIRVPVRFRP
jgi:hypothetical protein